MVLSMVLPEKLIQTNGVEGGVRNRLIQKTNFEKSGKIITLLKMQKQLIYVDKTKTNKIPELNLTP